MGCICYYNLQLCSQPHQSVTFSQIAFWNIKLSTEFRAYLVQPFTLICKKSGLWIFSVGTALLIQNLSELLINQPNGKYWKPITPVQKKALKVNSVHSSTITSFILFCAIPAMLKHSRERGCLFPGLHPKLPHRIKVDFFFPSSSDCLLPSLLVLILSWIHILFSRCWCWGQVTISLPFPTIRMKRTLGCWMETDFQER